MGLMHTDEKRYMSEAVQTEIAALLKGSETGKAEPARKGAEAEDKADADGGDWFPDTPSGYRIPDPPEELGERSGTDQEMIAAALEDFHAAGWDQSHVAKAIEVLDKAQAQALDAAGERIVSARETLRELYPHDLDENVQLANEHFRRFAEPYAPTKADRQAILELPLADGTRLGDYPPFVSAMIDMAKAAAGKSVERRSSGVPLPRRGTQPVDGRSDAGLEAEKARIMALMHTDEAAYKAAQPELERIITALNKRRK
jgi:hypothetical protein